VNSDVIDTIIPIKKNQLYHREHIYWLHYFLICWFIFLLFQDLLAENFKNIPIFMKVIKYVDEGVSLGVFVLLFVSCFINGRLLYKTNIDKPFIIFIIIALLSSITQKVPINIYMSQFIIYIKAFLTFYLMANLPMNRMTLRLYVRGVFGAGALIFFFGLIDFVFPSQFRSITGNKAFVQYFLNLPSVKSIFIHPLFFGWFMSFTGCYLFAYFTLLKKPYFIIGLVCAFIGCFLSFRAKAIIGLIYSIFTGFLLLVLKKQIKARLFFLFLLFFIILLVFFTPYIKEVLISKLQIYILTEDPTDVARNMLYIKSIEIARDKFPLGAGMGRYGSWYSRLFYSPLYYQYGLSEIYLLSKDMPLGINDTFWPMIIGEIGFFGTVFYALIFLIFLRSIYRQFTHSIDIEIKIFQFGTFMMFIESILESIASCLYVQPPFAFFIFGALGISYSLSRKDTLINFKMTKPSGY